MGCKNTVTALKVIDFKHQCILIPVAPDKNLQLIGTRHITLKRVSVVAHLDNLARVSVVAHLDNLARVSVVAHLDNLARVSVVAHLDNLARVSVVAHLDNLARRHHSFEEASQRW